MPTRRQVGFVCVIVALFLVANRASYKGYFSGDDLAAIALMRQVSLGQWLQALVTPVFNPDNFRPIGYALYGLLDRAFDNAGSLNFTPYLVTVQILHGLVTLLVYTLARRFGASTWAATIGALFFVFHMALFGAFWKPMYNFDIFCALFVIVSILASQKTGWQWWLASFVSFWLAYKSKEVAVMLPAVLLLIEYRGARRWLRLAPFVVVSLSFGLQAVLTNQTGAYHLALTPQTLAQTASYYADHVMLARIGIIALLAVVALARERWPILAALLFLAPMLALPGRVASVYLYVPMVFVAILAASAAERAPKCAAIALMIWFAFNFVEMRRLRNGALFEANQAREYVTAVERNAAQLRRSPTVRFDGYPISLEWWGAQAAVRLVAGPQKEPFPHLSLSWQPLEGKLYLFNDEPVPYLDMGTGTPIVRDPGWYHPEGRFRWTQSTAQLRLTKPTGASRFEMRVYITDVQVKKPGSSISVEVFLDGCSALSFTTSQIGWQTFSTSELPPNSGASTKVAIFVVPPTGDAGELGVAVGAIGFR